jgi:predicted RecB family nuclease
MGGSSKKQLSKSRFVAGSQCHKLLWWKVHERDAPELQPDKVLQDRFDQGTQVGELARTLFPGGVLIDLPYRDYEGKVAATEEALAAGAPVIYEASFMADGVFVAVDVLERVDGGFNLIEVKSSSRAKDEHIPDAAVQTHVLRKCGLDVRRAEIMHCNKEFRHPDEGELLVRTDVTAEVEDKLAGVPAEIEAQLEVINGPQPDIEIGTHCFEPRDCPFWDRCWPDTEHHITTLYYCGKAKAWGYMQQGYHTVLSLPPGTKLSKAAQRQRRALEQGEMIVEKGLGKALGEFDGRLGFLDFETVSRAIPVWDGLGPWHQAPVQFSYHEQQADGSYSHAAWLAEGPHDPREELAREMLAATAGAEKIVMYSSFERRCIRQLQEAVPHLATELEALEAKLIDLLPPIRNNVYHPDFQGSFSLKYVLPALVPGMSYKDLAIVDGMEASVEIARLLFVAHKIPVDQRAQLREDLLAYCERDTWAMVVLLGRLREVAAASPA